MRWFDRLLVLGATIAVIANTGNQVWFIKMRGDRDLVNTRQDEFKSFAKSLKFSQDGGAGNGNK